VTTYVREYVYLRVRMCGAQTEVSQIPRDLYVHVFACVRVVCARMRVRASQRSRQKESRSG
jgi:hypothetical protein